MTSRAFRWTALAVSAAIAALISGAAVASEEQIRDLVADLRQLPEGELPRRELEIAPRARRPWWIGRSEALEDNERFFILLEHGWCGYELFRMAGGGPAQGGDPFVDARRRVVSRLGERTSWSPRALAGLIHEQLDFVTDCHLKLGGESFCRHHDLWFDPGLRVSERAGAFRFRLGGEDHVLIGVNGGPPSPYLLPSLDAAGRKIWLLGTLASVEPGPLEVSALKAGREVRIERRLGSRRFRSDERFGEERIGGIPVVRIRTCSDVFGRELRALVEHAASHRGEPYLILDIRGNGGGNTVWPRRWIEAFTGASPTLKQALTELVGRTTMTGRANLFALSRSGYRAEEREWIEGELAHYRAAAATFDDPAARPYWTELAVPRFDTIRNDTTLIVIIDRDVASAGEGFVSFLKDQVSNVVLVGENTRGALTFGQLTAHRLPHSKLLAYLPIKLNVPLDLEFREAVGFRPDYWVPAPDALNHAVAAIRAGTIPTRLPLPANFVDAEFVPERPPPPWQLSRPEGILWAAVLLFGVLFAYSNRRRRRVFLVAGLMAAVVGAVFLLVVGSMAGVALLAVGSTFLVIGLARRADRAA